MRTRLTIKWAKWAISTSIFQVSTSKLLKKLVKKICILSKLLLGSTTTVVHLLSTSLDVFVLRAGSLNVRGIKKESAPAQPPPPYRKQLHVVHFINFHNYPHDIKGSRHRVRRPWDERQVAGSSGFDSRIQL